MLWEMDCFCLPALSLHRLQHTLHNQNLYERMNRRHDLNFDCWHIHWVIPHSQDWEEPKCGLEAWNMYVYWNKSASHSFFAAVYEHCQYSVILCRMADWGKLEGDRTLHDGCCNDCMLTKKNKKQIVSASRSKPCHLLHNPHADNEEKIWVLKMIFTQAQRLVGF